MTTVGKEYNRPVPPYCEKVLAQFGQNPYDGDNIFRVVWGPARKELIGGLWSDGTREYRLCSRYHQQAYVLEKWVRPQLYGTPEDWRETQSDSWGYLTCGPYPSRGDYETSHIFQVNGIAIPPYPTLLFLIAQGVERGKLFKLSDKRIALRDAKERKDKEWRDMVTDDWHDSQSSFEGPTIGYGGASGVKTADDVVLNKVTVPANVRRAKKSFSQL